MLCPRCKKQIADDEKICPECGEKIEETLLSIRPLACSSCGNRSLKRVRKGEYVCEYCGSHYLINEQADIDEEEAAAKLTSLFIEADEHREKGDIKAELKVLIRALDVAPEDCHLMLKISRAYRLLGNFKKACEYLVRAQNIDPNDPVVANNWAVLFINQDQYEMAKPYLEKSIRIIEEDPLSASLDDIAVTYGNYALCLGLLKDMDGARKYFKIARDKGLDDRTFFKMCKKLKADPDKLI